MEKLKDALSRFVGLQRVHVGDLGEPREAVVDFGVVLHRAGPLADVDVAVDADIFLREVVVMTHQLKLRDLGKIGLLLAHHAFGEGGEGLFRARTATAGSGDKDRARAGFAYLIDDRLIPLSLMKFL